MKSQQIVIDIFVDLETDLKDLNLYFAHVFISVYNIINAICVGHVKHICIQCNTDILQLNIYS